MPRRRPVDPKLLMANRRQPRNLFFAALADAVAFQGSGFGRIALREMRLLRRRPDFKRIP